MVNKRRIGILTVTNLVCSSENETCLHELELPYEDSISTQEAAEVIGLIFLHFAIAETDLDLLVLNRALISSPESDSAKLNSTFINYVHI
jgi:hypothetical protein